MVEFVELDGDDDDRGCKRKREEALREKSRRVKLQATGEIDFRDIAGSFDVAGAVSVLSVCVWVDGCARACTSYEYCIPISRPCQLSTRMPRSGVN